MNNWWVRDHPIPPGTDYRLSVDGGEPLPDPRSPWQPEGPRGPSRALDHSSFKWTDQDWRGAELADAAVYECHIGTFTPEGTFEAAIERLPHVADLGITALELMPVVEFPGMRGWGYDGVDLYAPHHSYGGPDGLKRFVDAAHAHGLAVIADVVCNHLGPDGNYLAQFGPYFTDRYSTPWGDAINFDRPHSDEVRRFFVDNALMWLRDYHFDGLRLDAVHAILDMSAVHILEQIKLEVEVLEETLDRSLWVIAESDLNDPRLVRDRTAGGYGLDAQWSDDFHHSLYAVLTGEDRGYFSDFGSLADLSKSLTNAFVYDGIYSKFRKRRHGRKPAGLSAHRFVVCLQNHDQIANSAGGSRTSGRVSVDLLKVGAALVLTSPFVPMLFQGEEWGAGSPFNYFTDHNEELGRLVTQGRKKEMSIFGWPEDEIPDPQAPTTFEESKLDWSELEDPLHADLLEWHKALIRLRAATPALSDGRLDLLEVRHDEADRWLAIERGPVTVACNLSNTETEIPLKSTRMGQRLLTSGKDPLLADNAVTLPPESVTIFST